MSQTLKLYIPKVLSENKVVLLRGIGTLRINYRPAEIDETTQTLIAPKEEIYFVPANESRLDPVLTKIVEVIARVDEEEAQTLVRNFMDELRDELRGNGFLTFPNIGWIKQDNWGSLFFEPAAEYIAINRFFGLRQVTLPEALTTSEQEVFDDLRKTAGERVEGAELQPREARSRSWGFIIGALLLLITFLAFQFFTRSNAPEDEAPVDVEEVITNIKEDRAERTLNMGAIEGDSATPPIKKKVVGPNFLPGEPENASVQTVQPVITECIIIVGAFAQSSNVERMIDRIEATTYDPVTIKGVRLTKVGLKFDCSDSEQEAAVLRWAKREFDKHAWVLP